MVTRELFSFAGVSIHASSREDATSGNPFRNASHGFNPRVLAGGRDMRYKVSSDRFLFQSTRPRGRTRRKVMPIIVRSNCFNPRVLAGGRD